MYHFQEVNRIAYLSRAAYKGNGSTVTFSAPFPYINKAHVSVTVNNSAVGFTWLNTGTVQLAAAPASGTAVVVKRVTPRNVRLVDFTDGSYLTERELDLSALQLLYILQEIIDDVADTLKYDFATDKYDAGGKPITNVGDPVNEADVVTLKYFTNVLLPLLLAKVEEAVNSFIGPIRDELEGYRKLLAEYQRQLELAAVQLETATKQAVERIEGMTGEAQNRFDAYMQQLSDTSELLVQQAEAVRIVANTAIDARDEVRALYADIKDFQYMGDWRNGVVYRPQNVVYHDGSSFVLVDGDGTDEPPHGGWKFLAKRGESYYARVIDGGEPETVFAAFIDGGTPDDDED